MNKELKIGWILSGNEVVPGARIQGFNIHRALKEMGVDSTILHAPDKYNLSVSREAIDPARIISDAYDIVIFQKVYEGDIESIAHQLKSAGVRIVYLSCELCGHNMVKACDHTIAVSPFLRTAYGRSFAGRISVIPDALEVDEDSRKMDYTQISNEASLKAVYLSSAMPDSPLLSILSVLNNQIQLSVLSSGYDPGKDDDEDEYRKPLLSRIGAALSTCPLTTFDRIIRRLKYRKTVADNVQTMKPTMDYDLVPWSIDTVCEEVIKHDIAVIPCDLTSDHNMSKSSNRLTMMMALGMPVIVSPLPAYLDVVEQGQNGFIASSPQEWRDAVKELSLPEARKRIGEKARADVIDKFSVENIARRYLEVIATKSHEETQKGI